MNVLSIMNGWIIYWLVGDIGRAIAQTSGAMPRRAKFEAAPRAAPPAKKDASQRAPSAHARTRLSQPRGERRKRETRERLLDAAFRLMAERGKDAVAIHQITEEADVALGSFYNHFDSKEAIYVAVITRVFDEFGAALDALAQDIGDLAEVVAVCVRHTIRRAQSEPLWGQLLIREGFSSAALTRGLGMRLARDIRAGAAAGRFKVHDVPMTVLSVGGAVLSALAASVHLAQLRAPERQSAESASGLELATLDQRMAASMLMSLGVPPGQSEKLATRPLPQVPR
jgi:AcrR family transcriptional regulator